MQSILPFIPLFFIWFLAAASPGPDFFIVVKHSLASRKSGIFTAIGIGCGILIHVSYCLLGLAFIISRSIVVFNILKVLAGFYLIYLGWKTWKTKSEEIHIHKTQVHLPPFQALRVGFFTNILNPKVTLFFLGLFTVGIQPDTPLLHQAVFGLIMSVGTMIWFSLVATFFSTQKMQHIFQKFSTVINRTFGTLLIALGIKIALTQK
jgi:RhtB (resistance to homoserine/threonine) family protein